MASGYDGHIAKRQKMEDGASGYNDIHNIEASKVVHVRGLPDYANEDDIVQTVQHFGHVDYVLTLPKRHQALVEFRDLASSRACVNYANTNKLLIGDYQIFVNFSTSQKIQRSHENEEVFSRGPSSPHKILLFTVVNAQYPITVDVMHTICSPHGRVEKIVIFKKQYVQAMVQFDTPASAKSARDQLHGCDIYSGCCTLRIEYARATELNVKANNTESWDYTNPNLGKPTGAGSQMDRRNPPLLADPRYAPAPTPYGEVDEFSGGGGDFGNQRSGQAGRGGSTGFTGGQYDQGSYEAPYLPTGRGAGRGIAQGGFAAAGRGAPQAGFNQPARPGAYGGQEGWNQDQRGGFGRGANQDAGYGGGYGQGGLMGQQGGFMEQQGPGGAGGAAQGCVVMVYGLEPDKMNCDKLFNLFCLYGNVIRIKYLQSKEGTAMVQLGDNMAVERSMFNINGVRLFGKKLAVTHSKQAYLQDVTNPHTLPDGTSSFKDFMGSRNNRFTTPEAAAKNRILHPTEIVHYYNAPPSIAEDDLTQLFTDNGGAAPTKVLQFKGKSDKSSNGLLEWDSKESAVEALCSVNHVSVPHAEGRPYVLKLCFSQSNIRK